MIIDVHTHLASSAVYPPAFVAGLLGVDETSIDRGAVASIARRWMSDQCGDKMVAEMDKAGILRSVLLMIDGGVRFTGGTGRRCTPWFANNKHAALPAT